MSQLTKRITAMLLAGMLVIGAVPGAVFAADADPGQTSEYAEEVFTEEETAEESSEAADAGAAGTSELNVADTSEETAVQYYTVTLVANGGYFENEWDDAVGEIVEQVETVTKHVPVDGTVAAFPVYKTEPDGRSIAFAGWSLERDGELVTMGDEEYIPVENCVLYAVWQASETEGAADLEEKGEQEVADKGTEQADSVQETEEVDSAAGDTITAEEGAIEEDTAVEANTDPETENEQDIVPDQQEVYEDEDTENISEESSDAVVSEEETHLELNESPGEEETVREDASNGVVENGTCGDNLSWTLDEEGTLTISGEGEMYDYDTYSIPWRVFRDRINEVVFDDTVERIGKYAFWDCDNLKTIHFPSCLSIIGQNAFDSCSSLTKIVLPEGLSQIGAFAFEYCSNLQSIFIPSSVSSIGSYVFSNCNKQLDISISDSNKAYCAINGVIFNKDKTVLLYYPNARAGTHYSVPTGIKRIYNSAFWNCTYLTSITLPDGLTDIQRYSFDQCFNLTEINIPDSVSRIGECAFNHCALIKLVIPSGVTNIEKQAFEYCTNLTELELQEGVENIGEGAFLNCDSLKSVTIPSSTISISASAFAGCTGLSDLMISEGVKEIGEAAFSGCGIKSITIPSSVIQMGNGNGNGVFFNCMEM